MKQILVNSLPAAQQGRPGGRRILSRNAKYQEKLHFTHTAKTSASDNCHIISTCIGHKRTMKS